MMIPLPNKNKENEAFVATFKSSCQCFFTFYRRTKGHPMRKENEAYSKETSKHLSCWHYHIWPFQTSLADFLHDFIFIFK